MTKLLEKLPVTVVVPVRNEASAIRSCLQKLAGFEAVVVVDSKSTDGTDKLALEMGAEVLQFNWNGSFPKKRNWVLRTYQFRTPWVFFLDADERVNAEFCTELRGALKKPAHDAFWVNYQNSFLGCELKFGEANKKLSLFRVGSGEYEEIGEQRWSSLDMEIHEHPIVKGRVGEIRSRVQHLDDRGYEHWVRKHNEYSSWEAQRIRLLKSRGDLSYRLLTPRQKVKYRMVGSQWFPCLYFVYIFLLKRGFLDGHAGLVYALSKAIYFWNISVKLRELQRCNLSRVQERSNQEDEPKSS
jgi:glycosyltransferase involved in cell wall biosynthesis